MVSRVNRGKVESIPLNPARLIRKVLVGAAAGVDRATTHQHDRDPRDPRVGTPARDTGRVDPAAPAPSGHPPTGDPLAALPGHRRAVFEARVRRWRPDLLEGLAELYPDPEAVAGRLVRLAARAYADRDDELHDLDYTRTLQPDWFQQPSMLGYAAYTERFAGDLRGVAGHTAYLQDLGVTYLHLMPLLTPRPRPNDGGYAVQDYRSVRPDLGTMEDLADLTRTLRAAGISLCLDLVLNHVAAEHEWARRARAGEQRYRDYFLTFADRELPDAYERTLPEVFPDFAPGSFSWDEQLGRWVWTTFNSWQWDLDWSNPDVLVEYADIVCFLANRGVEVLRLDAIAFTWKRMGTSCQNQPEVHALTQVLRAVARIAAPAVVFKAEAIVGPRDLPAYLGQGRHHGKVSDLAYHNSLMVQIWNMLATRDVRLTAHALAQLPAPPASTSWVTYARCHDDIGWAVDDGDAAALGVDGWAHRRYLADFYSGDVPGSFARGLLFQENEQTGDRRTCGMLASLAGAEAGDPLAVPRVLLVHAVVLGFGGLPVLWMGDELGLTNDWEWDAEPDHADDSRWLHRPRMPWGSPGDERIRAGVGHLVRARRALPHLHASVPSVPMLTRDPGVLLLRREHPLGPMLAAYNVTEQDRPVPESVLREAGLDPDRVEDRLSGTRPVLHDSEGERLLRLTAYQPVWLVAEGSVTATAATG